MTNSKTNVKEHVPVPKIVQSQSHDAKILPAASYLDAVRRVKDSGRSVVTSSHFSLVRTISGKEKILYYRELLVSENFLKHAGFHLFYPLQSFWAKTNFYYRELLVSETFLYNTGFFLWFYSLRRVSGLFWAKSIISLFFKFIHWFNICKPRSVQ